MATINHTWQEAHSHYAALRSASDALADTDPQADRAADAYCEAMDRLLQMPAPDHAALVVKIDLIAERYADFAMPPALLQIVRSDVTRLGGRA